MESAHLVVKLNRHYTRPTASQTALGPQLLCRERESVSYEEGRKRFVYTQSFPPAPHLHNLVSSPCRHVVPLAIEAQSTHLIVVNFLYIGRNLH